MLAREYNTLIEIWNQVFSPDGYGGNVPTDVFQKKVYAKIKTQAGNRFKQFGINDFKNPVIFSIRGKKSGVKITEKSFLMYHNKKYIIKGTEDVGIAGTETNIFCDEL